MGYTVWRLLLLIVSRHHQRGHKRIILFTTIASHPSNPNAWEHQERLERESRERAATRRAKEEAKARDKAAAVAAATTATKEEAEEVVRRLQKQHAEQVREHMGGGSGVVSHFALYVTDAEMLAMVVALRIPTMPRWMSASVSICAGLGCTLDAKMHEP